jgi:preprotein translocase subunit SecA
MDRALPEDVPIEARMVTKAIERAQHTVEERNADIRKHLLKSDEVMNEQRKVIYERRMQVIDGEDLAERTEQLLEDTVVALVQKACPRDFPEEWNLQQLLLEISQYYPTKFTAEDLRPATTADQLTESFLAEALAYYRSRESSMPGGAEMARDIERDVMLQIIDHRWQEHLVEIDHLKEGMDLRAMGGQDPVVAFQSEAFTMFGQLMDSIDDDYLRYVMHVDVLEKSPDEPDFSQFKYEAASDPVEGTASIAQALSSEAAKAGAPQGLMPEGSTGDQRSDDMSEPAQAVQAPVVLAEREKIGRNEPCWCGSGRKFKLCHGSR